MRLIRAIRQRITDWRRERRIAALSRAALSRAAAFHIGAKQGQLAREAHDAFMAERALRSDAQLTRLAVAELRRHPWLARAQMKQAEKGARRP